MVWMFEIWMFPKLSIFRWIFHYKPAIWGSIYGIPYLSLSQYQLETSRMMSDTHAKNTRACIFTRLKDAMIPYVSHVTIGIWVLVLHLRRCLGASLTTPLRVALANSLHPPQPVGLEVSTCAPDTLYHHGVIRVVYQPSFWSSRTISATSYNPRCNLPCFQDQFWRPACGARMMAMDTVFLDEWSPDLSFCQHPGCKKAWGAI